MNELSIQFVEEPESVLVKRKSLYIDPESDLSNTLSKIQDKIESEGFSVDRSRYKYVLGQLCKFSMELINEPDLATLNRRANSIKKLSLNLSKLKWEFQSRSFVLKIGKIQDKDLYITVAFVAEELGEIERERIKTVKDSIVKKENKVEEAPPVVVKMMSPIYTPAPIIEPPIIKNPVITTTKTTTLNVTREINSQPPPLVRKLSMFKIRG